jgi:hypothetical protein
MVDREHDGQVGNADAGDAGVVRGGPEGAASLCKTLLWLLPQPLQQLAIKVSGLWLTSRFLITSDRRGSPRPRDAVQEARSRPERLQECLQLQYFGVAKLVLIWRPRSGHGQVEHRRRGRDRECLNRRRRIDSCRRYRWRWRLSRHWAWCPLRRSSNCNVRRRRQRVHALECVESGGRAGDAKGEPQHQCEPGTTGNALFWINLSAQWRADRARAVSKSGLKLKRDCLPKGLFVIFACALPRRGHP